MQRTNDFEICKNKCSLVWLGNEITPPDSFVANVTCDGQTNLRWRPVQFIAVLLLLTSTVLIQIWSEIIKNNTESLFGSSFKNSHKTRKSKSRKAPKCISDLKNTAIALFPTIVKFRLSEFELEKKMPLISVFLWCGSVFCVPFK